MTETCKTCRFWEAAGCRCHKRFVDVPNSLRPFNPTTMRVYVYPSDGNSYVHLVFTGPDFGCIHHEPIVAGTEL